MQRALREVLEDEHHIELLEAELYTLQGGNLDLRQSNDEEGGIGEVDETLRRRLQTDVLTDRYTFERQLTERNIDLEGVPRLDEQRVRW